MTTDPPTIAELATSLRRRTTSAAELLTAALHRIAGHNPTLNAFAIVDAPGALDAARTADRELAAGVDRGPLHGIPVGVKDMVDVAGLPTSCGSAATGFGVRQADRDAAIVTRLRDAGAVVVGKTTLHEFAYGATGDRSVHGPSRNPHDVGRISGGSSGGSAVAVAAGLVPLAVGTDTVGSVRVPAALCGVAGFKPAFDALPTDGVHPLAPSLDHVGLLATTSADLALAYDALAGTSVVTSDVPDRTAPDDWTTTVGWIPPDALVPTDGRIEAQVRALLGRAGLEPAPVHGMAPDEGPTLFETVSTLQRREAFRLHEHHLERDRHLIDDEVLDRLYSGRDVSAAAYRAADAARHAFRSRVRDLLAAHRVLALPTTAIVAPRLGQRAVRVGDAELEVRATLLALTSPWNLAAVPALSVPAGRVDGLPIAVQLVAAAGDEAELFTIARRFDTAGKT